MNDAQEKSTTFKGLVQRIPVVRGLLTGRSLCVLHCDKEPQKGSPIFVAVHGTFWVSRAGWTQHNSKLLLAISKKWPDAGIYRFEWSGVNGASHRLDAADVLAERLADLASHYDTSSIVTIAHSHGGNVVAWAATQLKRPLDAAIYLNTPFIQVLRDSKASSNWLRVALGVFALYSVIGVPMVLLGVKGRQNSIAIMITLILVMILLEVAVAPRIEAIRERLVCVSNGARRVAKELVVFVVGDEASAGLGAVYFAHWLVRRWGLWLTVIMFCVSTLFIVFASYFPRGDQIGAWIYRGWVAILYLFFAVAVGGYGMAHGLVALDSAVTVTPAPTGEMDFATVGWTDKDQLRHSLIYESTEAIATMITWLERCTQSEPIE